MEPSTGARAPPPSWINRDFVECALNKGERKKITVETMKVEYANAEGVGYGSLMFRLTALLRYEDTEETQRKTLILKTILQSGEIKSMLETCDVFRMEGEMLHDVMPQIHEKLAALEGAEFRPLAAECYLWGRQPADFLLLEDLRATGFRTAPAGRPLDLEHCAVALRSYARLHAASAYVVSRRPHYKDSFSFDMFTNKNFREFMENMGKKLIIALANELDRCPGYEKYSERYRAFADRLIEIMYKKMEPIKTQTKLPVLTHGDCWKNNMMFKYVNGEVSEIRLVDFQGPSVTSPARDLTYFLYANASEEVHRHHMDDLLSQYHSTLVGLLRRLGMEGEAEAYTLQELKTDMDHCLVAGLYFSCLTGFVMTSEENAVEYAEAFNDQTKFNNVAIKSLKNPYSLPYIKYLTPIFISKGIL